MPYWMAKSVGEYVIDFHYRPPFNSGISDSKEEMGQKEASIDDRC